MKLGGMALLVGLLIAESMVAGCGQSAPKQSYAEALQVYTNERAELDRLETEYKPIELLARGALEGHVQWARATVELEESKLASADTPWTREERASRIEKQMFKEPWRLKTIDDVRRQEADLSKKVAAQRRRVDEADKAKNRLVP